MILVLLVGASSMDTVSSQAANLTFTASRIADASITYAGPFHESQDVSKLLRMIETETADRFRNEVLTVPRTGRTTWSILLPRCLPSVESVEARSQAVNLRQLRR